MGSLRPLFLVGGKWSVRPSEFKKSAAKGASMLDLDSSAPQHLTQVSNLCRYLPPYICIGYI